MRRRREEQDALEQAALWRMQAGVLRRRAAREGSTEEQRAEAMARADWHDRRAEIVDASYPTPPIFPRDLRTPLDRLDLVDDLRRALDDVLVLSMAIEDSEIVAFGEAVRRARGPVLPVTEAITRVRHAAAIALEAAPCLGVSRVADRVTFEDYAIELVDGDNLDNADT